MLIEISQFVEKYFAEGSRPSKPTIRRWLRQGALPGALKIGGTWYVDEIRFQAAPKTGNAKADEILNDTAKELDARASKMKAQVDAMVSKILNSSPKQVR